MDDVNIRIVYQIPPIMIGLELGPEPFFTFLQSIFKVFLIYIANGDEAAALIAGEMEAAHSDTSDTNDSAGHLVARCDEPAGRISHLSEYFSRKDGQSAQSQTCLLDEISSGLCHD